MTDKWIHRSPNMRCLGCMYYVPKKSSDPLSSRIGRCRRHSPTLGGWPVVFPEDWCGDHKLSEDAVDVGVG